ncbi:MAG: A24 family peptidase, partial [Planctomycetota bacterium]
AVAYRPWRRRCSFGRNLRLCTARLWQSIRLRPLREITILGTLAVAMVWYGGGSAWTGLLSALVGMVGSGGVVWLVRIIGTAALGREAMGFGDVTLMMMVGAFIGWQAGLIVFFLAPFAGLLLGLVKLLVRGDKEIPYGPFLCLAVCFVVVRWASIWPAVENFFGAGLLVPTVLVVCLAMLGVLLGLLQLAKRAVGG